MFEEPVNKIIIIGIVHYLVILFVQTHYPDEDVIPAKDDSDSDPEQYQFKRVRIIIPVAFMVNLDVHTLARLTRRHHCPLVQTEQEPPFKIQSRNLLQWSLLPATGEYTSYRRGPCYRRGSRYTSSLLQSRNWYRGGSRYMLQERFMAITAIKLMSHQVLI